VSLLGLERSTVSLSPHHEKWHSLFAEESDRLVAAAPTDIIGIEHIGSTAVCRVSAKPILDIMLGIKRFEPELSFAPQIERLGYEYKGENGVPERHFFGKGVPRIVHLNVVEHGGEFWLSHLGFRDHLLHNKEAAQEYETLKKTLARKISKRP
jgi:GrpB-like predicted nucleotidyltransferase (UPF0157 family)